MCTVVVVSRSGSIEMGSCLGASVLADQTRIHLIEKRGLSIWISIDFAFLGQGPWGSEWTITPHAFRSASSLPFSHVALVPINDFFISISLVGDRIFLSILSIG